MSLNSSHQALWRFLGDGSLTIKHHWCQEFYPTNLIEALVDVPSGSELQQVENNLWTGMHELVSDQLGVF